MGMEENVCSCSGTTLVEKTPQNCSTYKKQQYPFLTNTNTILLRKCQDGRGEPKNESHKRVKFYARNQDPGMAQHSARLFEILAKWSSTVNASGEPLPLATSAAMLPLSRPIRVRAPYSAKGLSAPVYLAYTRPQTTLHTDRR